MALSLLYNPVDYSSAHGDLIFTLLEDTKPFNASLYPDYKYVCDIIYVDGGGGQTLVARLKAYPRPNGKIGVFNIGNVVRNYLTAIFAPHPTNIHYQIMAAEKFFTQIICRFGEEYGFVTYPNIIVDTQRSYFNHYNGRQFGTNTILTPFLDRVLSSRPYATAVLRNQTHCLLPFFCSDDDQVTIEFRCYNSTGLVRQVTATIDPTPASANELAQVNVSPLAVNNAHPGAIDDYIDYYTVTFNTTNIVDDSVYRFNLICERKHQAQTLHFLNKYGGFESKEFNKVSRKTSISEKADYGTPAYTIDSNGAVSFFDTTSKVYKEQVSTYASQWTEKMQLNTDLLSDEEYVWLGELVKSPMVYSYQNGYFYSVKITDTNYEEKKNINDDLTNLTINIEFGDRFNTQYR